MKLPSVPPSPVRAMGGSPALIRGGKTDTNPTLQVGKVRSLQSPQVTLASTCRLGNLLVAGADPPVEVVEVTQIAAPEAPRRLVLINDNYCFKEPVLVNRSVVKSVLPPETNVFCNVVKPVLFVPRNIRQPQKKGLSPLSEKKLEINSVNCVSFVDQFVSAHPATSAPSVANAQPVGGRLQEFWHQWSLLGANPRVMSFLKDGYILPFSHRPPLV